MVQQLKSLIRLANTDIDGDKRTVFALTKIPGISYSFSNAMCNVLNIDKMKKAGELSENEIKAVESFLKNPKNIPSWLYNRKKDIDTGQDLHLTGADLRLKKEFDIRLMQKIKSYRGIRHALGLPVRGQKTRSHFREGKTVGVMKKAAKLAIAKAGKTEEKKEKK